MTWCLSQRVKKNQVATLLNSEQCYRLHWVYCKLEVNVPLVPSWITPCPHKDIEALLRLHWGSISLQLPRTQREGEAIRENCLLFVEDLGEVLSMVMDSGLEETDATGGVLLAIGDGRQATSSPTTNQRGHSISSGLGMRRSDSDVW